MADSKTFVLEWQLDLGGRVGAEVPIDPVTIPAQIRTRTNTFDLTAKPCERVSFKVRWQRRG
jgi:hypothetical protein